MGNLGWGESTHDEPFLNRLQLRAEPDLPGGRVALYVCSECADLGCGAIGAFVRREKDALTWSEFAFETDYSDLDIDGQDIGGGPYLVDGFPGFRFRANEYEIKLSSIPKRPVLTLS